MSASLVDNQVAHKVMETIDYDSGQTVCTKYLKHSFVLR